MATSWWSKDTVAVVTGANKGIGFEIVRLLAENGLTVVLTARDPARGKAAVDVLKSNGLQSVAFHPLEVSSPESVQKLATWLKSEFGGIDILVNNAGVAFNDVNYANAKAIIETNYYGLRNVTEGLLPLLRASSAGARIVNTSSRAGLYERLTGESLKQKFRDEDNYSTEFTDKMATQYLEDMKAREGTDERSWPWVPNTIEKSPMYSESKILVNAYAVSLARSLQKSQPENHKIFLVSFCPGATKTDMLEAAIQGGAVFPDLKTPTEGAKTGVWLALLPKEELIEKNGKIFGEMAEFKLGMIVNFYGDATLNDMVQSVQYITGRQTWEEMLRTIVCSRHSCHLNIVESSCRRFIV